MIEVDSNKFEIEFFDKPYGFFGQVKSGLFKEPIYLKIVSDFYEHFDITFMQIQYSNEENALQRYNHQLEHGKGFWKKEVFKDRKLLDYLLNEAVIEIDAKSAIKLREGDKYVQSMVFHEIGHFLHREKVYEESQSDRRKAIIENRVIERELDADEFAFQICGETAIEALKEQEKKLQGILELHSDVLSDEEIKEVSIVIKEHTLRIAHLKELLSKMS